MSVDFINEGQFQHVIDAAMETARSVNTNATRTQAFQVIFHGPKSQDSKNKLPVYSRQLEEQKMFIPEGNKIILYPKSTSYSYILEGLVNNNIVITSKINHIFIRNCSRLTIEAPEGTISGIDVLKCDNVNMQIPYHNHTNVELVNGTSIRGGITGDSQIFVRNCWDVLLNGKTVHVTPFHSALVTAEGAAIESTSPPPKLTLSSSLYYRNKST